MEPVHMSYNKQLALRYQCLCLQLCLNLTGALHPPNLKPPSFFFPFRFTQIFWFSAPSIQSTSPVPPNQTPNLSCAHHYSPSVIYSPPTTSPFTPLSQVIATQRITPTWAWTHGRFKRSPLLLHRRPRGTLGNHRKNSDIGIRVECVSSWKG